MIALAGLCVYANSLSVPFVLDDTASILENRQIREWWDLAGLVRSERELPVAGRPVVNASFALNYALGGLNVFGYHLWNIAVHIACALVLFGIVRRTLDGSRFTRFDGRAQVSGRPQGADATARPRRALNPAFAVALLWALHPLNTEAVVYLTQRTESMMGLFYLLTLYAAIRAAGTAGWKGWPAVAVVACALGMGCKESMVTAPLMVVLYDRVFLFDSFRAALRRRASLYAGLAGGWIVLAALLSSGPRMHSAGFTTDVSPWTYLLNQAVMIVRYLWLSIWPRALVANYGWPRDLSLADVLPQALAVSALLLATVAALRWKPPVGFLGAWFFVTLAPTSSIVPIATEVGAERRMYLPLIPLVVLAVAGGALLRAAWNTRDQEAGSMTAREAWPAGRWVLLAVSIALAMGTIARNREYGSSLRLAETVIERFPTAVGHHTLAVELLLEGRRAEAITHLYQAIPDAPRAYLTLGIELFKDGRLTEAVEALQTFLREQPALLEAVSARQLLGRTLAAQGRWPEAIEQYSLVLTMNPSPQQRIEVAGLRGDAYIKTGAYADAIRDFSPYLHARPSDPAALTNMGIALAATDRLAEAIVVFRRAVDADPRDGALQLNLANALFDNRDLAGAEVQARRALELRPDDPAAHTLIGKILAIQGRWPEAIARLEAALRLDPEFADARTNLTNVLRATGGRRTAPRAAPGR